MEDHIPYAVIDMGSNSLRMMTGVQDITGQWSFSAKELATTRLGNHIEETGHLWPEGMAASFAALSRWRDRLQGMRVCVVATSAVREARDGKAFLAEIRARYGWHCRILTGGEEALLSFCGAAAAVALHIRTAVLDIGGGSSELALGYGGIASWSHSYPLGAVRLTKQKQWSLDDIEKMKQHCLQTFLPAVHMADTIIGVGGTLTTLAAMDQGLVVYDAAAVEGYTVTQKTIGEWINRLQAMSPEERKHVPGLQPKRSDIILPGLVIAWSFLEYYQKTALIVSERDLMEGVFYHHAFYDAAQRMGADDAWN